MDRGTWRATAHRIAKELDTTKQLNTHAHWWFRGAAASEDAVPVHSAPGLLAARSPAARAALQVPSHPQIDCSLALLFLNLYLCISRKFCS